MPSIGITSKEVTALPGSLKKEIPWTMIVVASIDRSGTVGSALAGQNITNQYLIFSSKNVPETIKITRPINWTERKTPGGETGDMMFANMGAERVSFSIKTANFNDKLGVFGIQQFFNLLRTPDVMVSSGISKPFTPNPQVLYHYGVGNVPLYYNVTKCDFTTEKFNPFGYPQVIEIDLELVVDESGVLYQTERAASIASSKLQILSLLNAVKPGFTYRDSGEIVPGVKLF